MTKITEIVEESGDCMGYVGHGKIDPEKFIEAIEQEFGAEMETSEVTHGLARWRPVNPHSPDYEYWKVVLEPTNKRGHGVFETTEVYY